MPKSLVLAVTKESLIQALDKFVEVNPKLKSSTKYDLLYKGLRFPPKEVVREAARIQNIKNWWEFNLSGGDSTNEPLRKMGFEIVKKDDFDFESNFILLLRNIGHENCKNYFDCVDILKSKLHWIEGDTRFSFGTSENNKLTITIGQRYCLNYQLYDERPWQFISNANLSFSSDDIEVGEFQGSPLAYFNKSKSFASLFNNISELTVACDQEMRRAQLSGFAKFSNQFFEDAIFNNQYRIELFNKAFKKIKSDLNNLPMNHSLNTILYGPPGTGKTFNCINKALEILGVETQVLTRKEIKEEFDKRVAEGQVVFTTFHQSMNYEDFIEGIKPKTVDGKITYEIEDGIFKQLCNKARFVSGNLLEVLEKFKK